MSVGSGAFARRFLQVRPLNGANNSAYRYANAIIGLGSAAYRSRGLAGSSAGSNVTNARSSVSLGISNKPWHLPPPPETSAASGSSYQSPLERLKHPSRGGQDLGNRYVRLERSLRGKEGYQREIEEFRDEEESLNANASAVDKKEKGDANVVKRRKGKQPLMFMGYTIPEAPKPPGPDECCMSGCAVCVHDLYAEALDAHESTLQSIRSALHDKGVAEETWPKQLRYGLSAEAIEGENDNASLSAFEQMELQLAAKKRAQEQKHTMTPSRRDLESDRPRNFVQETDPGTAPRSKPRERPRRRSNSAARGTKIDVKDILKALSWVVFSRR
ncbi:hypothetical protein ACEPAI_2912 [Sanghuangporus weigelae]